MDVLEALRNHLSNEGIVRAPENAGPLPPMWLEPQHGTPAPGEGNVPREVGETTVLSAQLGGGIPQEPMTARFIKQQNVDVIIRVNRADLARTIANPIIDQINDKRNWDMGGLTVIQSRIWKELQPTAFTEQAFTFVVGFGFELYV